MNPGSRQRKPSSELREELGIEVTVGDVFEIGFHADESKDIVLSFIVVLSFMAHHVAMRQRKCVGYHQTKL